jgi:Rieske Fe-S protein
VAGMLIADLIQGRSGDWGAVFDPARFKPLTSARNFLSHNIDVAEAFIGGAISRPSGSAADIRPGEGRVIMVDNEKTAVSRDRDGNPEAVQASCTHMGCIVRWNDAEGSWDCPCHGSRFAGDGRVIHGPALKDLPRRKPREE